MSPRAAEYGNAAGFSRIDFPPRFEYFDLFDRFVYCYTASIEGVLTCLIVQH